MARIGLVAGSGNLPIIFSRFAKEKGDTIIAFGLKGVTDSALESHVHKMHWLDWGNLKKGLFLLATERLKNIVLLGKLKKELFFKGDGGMDDVAKEALAKIGDRKDSAIFDEVAKLFGKIGVEVIDSTIYLKDYIPVKGVLTKREPLKNEWDDISYGKDVAKSMSGFDIGQTIAVKDKTVIAVEAVEGTDEAIARAGNLVKGGFVIVKVARPNQDMRFDVPLVGLDTLKALITAGGTALALEEKKTLLMDREELIKAADDKNISIAII